MSPAAAPFIPSPPVEEDPFAFFGESPQEGTSEPTRPGIFLQGLEATRRREEGVATAEPPRVPVFGGGSGANMSQMFAEKMALSEAITQTEAPSLSFPSAGDMFAGLHAEEEAGHDGIRIEYLASEHAALQSYGEALEGAPPAPPFSSPSSAELLLPHEPSTFSREPSAFLPEQSAFLPEPPAFSPEPSAFPPEQSAFLPEPSAFSPEPSAFEQNLSPEGAETVFAHPQPSVEEGVFAQGALSSLLSATSEELQAKEASEMRADESDIRRAFVQSKTKVKRRKRWRRLLKVLALLFLAAAIISGAIIYWKEGQVFRRKPTGQVDWIKTFSWERLKKNLFSEAFAEGEAKGLYALHAEPEAGGEGEALKPRAPTSTRT